MGYRNWNNDNCCFLGGMAESSAMGLAVVAAGVVVSVVDWIEPAGVVWLPICLVDCYGAGLG
jgi:hypothetical protein